MAQLTPEEKEAVGEALVKEKYSDGDFIVHEGELGDKFYAGCYKDGFCAQRMFKLI